MAKKPEKAQEIFTWKGTDRQGKKVTGEMEAQGPAYVRSTLRREGINPRSVRKKPKSLFSKKDQTQRYFNCQSPTCNHAGCGACRLRNPIKPSPTERITPKVREIFGAVRLDVESGTALSEALQKFPRQFDPLYISLVAVGERSGNLDDLMDKVSLYMENIEEIKAKVKGALWYPAAVLAVGFIVSVLLLVFVIPQFEDLFSSFGASLPALTAIVIELSRNFRDLWLQIFGIIIGAIIIISMSYRRSEAMRHRVDRIALRLPVFGIILRKSAISRFARTLATMFGSGVPLVDGLESVAGATGNRVYSDGCISIREVVSGGQSLSRAMSQTGLFPSMILQMTSTGEESGELETMLNKAADFYEREVREAVDNMSKLIEPIMISVLGGLVGTLVIAMYLPIFKMGSIM